jgi:hypothetical protein
VTEAAQFALDTHDTPGAVLGSQTHDQRDQVVADRRPARWLGLAPFGGQQPTVPAQQRAWGDDPMRAQRLGYDACQRSQDRPIRPRQQRVRVRPAQHRNLVPQHKDLRVLRRRGTRQQNQPGHQHVQQTVKQSDHHEHRSSPAQIMQVNPQ